MNSAEWKIARNLLMVLALGLPSAVWPTQVQPLTLSEMVGRSAQIVHGVVQKTHTAWEGGGARLYTYVTLEIREQLKGPGGDRTTITFRQFGGRDGEQIIYVPGTPRFTAKEEVLLFLTAEDSGGFPQIMGIFQGAFRPLAGSGGERRVVGMTPEVASSIRPDLPDQATDGARLRPSFLNGGSFRDFLEKIRSLVEEQERGRRP